MNHKPADGDRWSLPATPASRLGDRALIRSLSFMEQHLAEALSVSDIARAACLSPSHFSRCFRRTTGKSPMAYLMQRRVERARDLLAAGERHNLSQLAIDLGFCDQSHFCRVFRRLTGSPPSHYSRAACPP